jgi:glutathione S-transferase
MALPEKGTRVLWVDSRLCSPWALLIWVVLREKKIPYELRRVDLKAGENRTPEYLSRAPSGKIPVLQEADTWLSESLAIAEYLDETSDGPRLLPADPLARARDREVLSYLRSDFSELRRCMPFEGLFWSQPAVTMTPKADVEIARVFDLVHKRLAAKAPEPPTLADFELAFMVRRVLHYDPKRVPADVVEFSERIWSRPSVQSWVTSELRPAHE